MKRALLLFFLIFFLFSERIFTMENEKKFEAILINIEKNISDSEKLKINFKDLNSYFEKYGKFPEEKSTSELTSRIINNILHIYSEMKFVMDEPENSLYAIGGYGEQSARLDLNCKNQNEQKYFLQLTSDKYIEFKKNEKSNEIEASCGSSVFFQLTKVSMVPSENIIKIVPGGIYFQILDFFEKKLKISKTDSTITILNLRKSPTYYLPAYKEHEKILTFSPVFGKIKGRQIEAVMTEKGNFTIGATVNNMPMDLLYGHPNESGQDGLWTTNLSVKIGKKIYKFSSLNNIKTNINQQINEISAIGEVPESNILIRISLKVISSEMEKIRVTIGAENKDNKEEEIGFRLLLDTWAGEDDGVPFTIPGAYGSENFIHQNEVRFNPITSSVWETLDSNDSGFSLIRNTLIGGELTPPDELAFVNWGEAYNTLWDYQVDKEIPLTGDSAVLNWWNSRKIKPNEKIEISTDYSTFQRKKGIYFQMEDTKAGFGYIYIQYPNSDEKKDISYSLELDKGKLQNYYSLENKLNFQVKPREVLNRIVPVTLIGNGKNNLKIIEKINGLEKVYNFEVNLPETERGITSPVWASDKKYPIQYISEQTGLKLKGRLKDKNNGNTLGEIDLAPVKSGLNQIYSGEVKLIGEFSGEVDVEILDMSKEP